MRIRRRGKMNVREKLALECVLMSLNSRVLPKKDEDAASFAHRLHDLGSGILAEMLMEADVQDDEGGGSPIYTEADDVSQEFEPEETLTEGTRIRYYIDEDGKEDWYSLSEPSARMEVTQELKKEFDIPAGMPPEDFVKMFRVLSKGRSPLQVWLQNVYLTNKWGKVTWSVTPPIKPD
jgi:hypothetical protein